MTMTMKKYNTSNDRQQQLHHHHPPPHRPRLLFWNGKGPSSSSSFSLSFVVRCISVFLLISTLLVNVRFIQSLTKRNKTAARSSSNGQSSSTGQKKSSSSLSSSSSLNGIHLQPSLNDPHDHPLHPRGRPSSVTAAAATAKLKATTSSDIVMQEKKQQRIRQEDGGSGTLTTHIETRRRQQPTTATASAGASAASSISALPLWESSTILPRWMKDYFTWHAEQRRLLSSLAAKVAAASQQQGGGHAKASSDVIVKNLQQFKFLVVRCLQQDDKCGGTADRLKPLPFYLRLAHSLQRILIFKWQRPVPLEEFLQPPQHNNHDGNSDTVIIGMDWTWPAFLDDYHDYYNFSNAQEPEIYNAKHIKQYSGWNLPRKSLNEKQDVANSNGKKKKKQQQARTVKQKPLPQAVISMRYQNHGHGADEYDWLAAQNNNNNETTKEATFAQVFRDAWHVVFEPVPIIQQRLDEIMASTSWTNVKPNTYDAIHIRALYHNSQPDINSLHSLSRHAVNCLHTLQLQQQQQHTNTTTNNSSSLALQLQQEQEQYPIFIASDDVRASDFAHAYANFRGVRTLRSSSSVISNIIAIDTAALATPVHLDRGENFLARRVENWTTHEASRYYNVFVDLYLLANARCIAYNVGNFGKWANLLSLHPDCEISHLKNKCPWNETTNE